MYLTEVSCLFGKISVVVSLFLYGEKGKSSFISDSLSSIKAVSEDKIIFF